MCIRDRLKDGGYDYHNADCFEITIPEWLKSAQAIYYDCASLGKSIEIIKRDKIEHVIVYIMTCRIGPFFSYYAREIKRLGGKVYLNPDGHEWMRAKSVSYTHLDVYKRQICKSYSSKI